MGDDATAADACTLYANRLGYGNMRPAEAQPWLELAAASIARLGGDAERAARLAIVEGSIRLFSEWRLEEAEALVVPARGTLAHLHGEDYYLVVAADDVLGTSRCARTAPPRRSSSSGAASARACRCSRPNIRWS